MGMPDAAFGAQPTNQTVTQGFLSDINAGNTGGLQSILNQLASGTAPGMIVSDLQTALAGNQFGINTAQYNLSNQQLEQQAQNQLQQLMIGGEQIGLQGQGLQSQAGLLGVTSGLEQQEYGLQSQQYPEQLAEANINYGNNQQNLVGNLAAQGALNTKGSTNQQGLLAENWAWQTQDIQRAQKLAGLQQQGTLAQQQYSAADIARQQQNLTLLAQSNGLSEQEVYQQLQYGLQQSGLDYKQNLPQLLQSLTQIWGGDLSNIEGALGEAGLLSGSQVTQATQAAGLNGVAPGVTLANG